MFCGGRRCKYESSSNWKKDDVVTDGIYSHWITDDLLGAKYLGFSSSRCLKTREKCISLLSLYILLGKCVYFSIFE